MMFIIQIKSEERHYRVPMLTDVVVIALQKTDCKLTYGYEADLTQDIGTCRLHNCLSKNSQKFFTCLELIYLLDIKYTLSM